MPTGFTHKIYDNIPITFAEFVWSCAKYMGALYHLRDDAGGVPSLAAALDNSGSSVEHHRRELAEAERHLANIEAMTPNSMQAMLDARLAQREAEHADAVRRNTDLRRRYDAMLDEVKAWVAPTGDHENFRAFMIEQLESSIRHDCYDPEPPRRFDLDEFRRVEVDYARWKVDYHRKSLAEVKESEALRRAWVEALHASVSCPK